MQPLKEPSKEPLKEHLKEPLKEHLMQPLKGPSKEPLKKHFKESLKGTLNPKPLMQPLKEPLKASTPKPLCPGRTYAQGFSEQLGLEFTSTLRIGMLTFRAYVLFFSRLGFIGFRVGV